MGHSLKKPFTLFFSLHQIGRLGFFFVVVVVVVDDDDDGDVVDDGDDVVCVERHLLIQGVPGYWYRSCERKLSQLLELENILKEISRTSDRGIGRVGNDNDMTRTPESMGGGRVDPGRVRLGVDTVNSAPVNPRT